MKPIKPLEDLLFEKGKISETQLKQFNDAKTAHPIDGIKYLLDHQMTTESEINEIMSEEFDIPFVNLENYIIDPAVLDALDESSVRKFHILPLYTVKDVLTVAIADLKNILEREEICGLTKFHKIQFAMATQSAIQKAIDQNYSDRNKLEDIAKSLVDQNEIIIPDSKMTPQALTSLAEEPPIVKFVNQMILGAVRSQASDIHVERLQDQMRVRYRVDGVLQTTASFPGEARMPIVPRIKILAQLDVAETRRPQDGRFSVLFEGRRIDLRVATFNTAFGENASLRLLDKASALFDLKNLGFSNDVQKDIKKFIKTSYGMMLLTGPTGCGKTTTLYAILNQISSPEKNILTIEDPIEYTIDNVVQAEVNLKINLDFASALRSFLRHDPDVIMVGEIRDRETAEVSFRAATTGHFVLSTLHTSDTPTAISRLRDLGLDNNAISASLICILAQRLVRIICPFCKEEYRPHESVFEELQIKPNGKCKYFRGKKCDECKGTGYKGRDVIFELLKFEDRIKALIVKNASVDEIRQAAVKETGMKSLRECGLDKVKAGITTLDEILRVTKE